MREPREVRFTSLVQLALLALAGCTMGAIGGDQGGVPLPPAPAAPGTSGGAVGGNGASSGASSPSGSSTSGNPSGSTSNADGGASSGIDAAPSGPQPGVHDLSTDRNLFFGTSRCAQSGAQFCEDFENGLDTNTWQVVGAAPVVDGTQHARGSKALHIATGVQGVSYVKEKKTFPAPNNSYWGRAFYYFAQMPSPPGMDFAHWTIAAASGTQVQGEIRVGGFLTNGANFFGVGTDSGNMPGGTGDWTTLDDDPAGKPNAIPLGKWVCVEWQHSGATNETRFYWDAVEHPSLHTTADKNGGNGNPYILPQFTELWIGWAEYQASAENVEMWVDEIIVDKERIGCVL